MRATFDLSDGCPGQSARLCSTTTQRLLWCGARDVLGCVHNGHKDGGIEWLRKSPSATTPYPLPPTCAGRRREVSARPSSTGRASSRARGSRAPDHGEGRPAPERHRPWREGPCSCSRRCTGSRERAAGPLGEVDPGAGDGQCGRGVVRASSPARRAHDDRRHVREPEDDHAAADHQHARPRGLRRRLLDHDGSYHFGCASGARSGGERRQGQAEHSRGDQLGGSLHRLAFLSCLPAARTRPRSARTAPRTGVTARRATRSGTCPFA